MEWFEHLYTEAFIELCGFADPVQTKIEAKFVMDALQLSPDSKLLDLCCGFGRHTFEMANISQCAVTGLDLSDEYLRIADKRHAAPNISYQKGDMRNIPFDGEFDAVTNLFTSFGFFDNDAENEQVIGEINKALKPEGLFFLDYENKFWFVRNDVLPKQRAWQQKDDDTYYLIENEYDVMNEREVYAVKIIKQGELIEQVGYNIRLYSLPELRAMLEKNGFEIVDIWGDYVGNPYSVYSKRLITLSRKIQ